MNKFRFIFEVILVAVFVTPISLRAQSPDKNVEIRILKTMVSYYIDNEKFDKAIAASKNYLLKFKDDHEAYRLLGLAYSKGLDFENAGKSFKQAARFSKSKEKGVNLFLEAVAEEKGGNWGQAAKTMEELKAVPEYKNYATKAMGLLDEKKEIPQLESAEPNEKEEEEDKAAKKPGSPTLSGSLAYGLDSNPLFLPDLVSATTTQSSKFISPTLDGSFTVDVLGSPLKNNVGLGYTEYTEQFAKQFNNLRFSLGSSWPLPGDWGKVHKVTLSNQFEISYTNDQRFQLYYISDALGVKKGLYENGRQAVELGANVGYKKFPNTVVSDPVENKEGPSVLAKLVHKHAVSELGLSEMVSYQKQLPKGKKYHADVLTLIGMVQTKLFWGLSTGVGLSWANTKYPNFGPARNDKTLSAGLDLIKKFVEPEKLSSTLSYGYTKNTSNQSDSNYSQQTVTLKVTYEFL